MVSYLFTGAIDQSVVEGGPENNLRDAGKETENWAGYIGALCSHYLIFKGLGFSMLLVPFWMLNFGYKLIQSLGRHSNDQQTLLHFHLERTLIMIISRHESAKAVDASQQGSRNMVQVRQQDIFGSHGPG